ncbi:MAG: hypothetical protein J5602_03410, partial [Clostridia bacterium]|nr:hypothetical protein [Clostridia bacterium]
MIRNRTGKFLFDAEMPAAETGASIGVRTDRFTVLNVSRFEVAGDSEPASASTAAMPARPISAAIRRGKASCSRAALCRAGRTASRSFRKAGRS